MIKAICSVLALEYETSCIKIQTRVIGCTESFSLTVTTLITDLSLSEDAIRAAVRANVATTIMSYASENGFSITISESEVRLLS